MALISSHSQSSPRHPQTHLLVWEQVHQEGVLLQLWLLELALHDLLDEEPLLDWRYVFSANVIWVSC